MGADFVGGTRVRATAELEQFLNSSFFPLVFLVERERKKSENDDGRILISISAMVIEIAIVYATIRAVSVSQVYGCKAGTGWDGLRLGKSQQPYDDKEEGISLSDLISIKKYAVTFGFPRDRSCAVPSTLNLTTNI